MYKLILAIALALVTTTAAALTTEQKELVATTLNLNGHLCAEVVSAKVLENLGNAGVIEAVCVKYEGGSGRATYMIDMETGRAWEQ